MQDRDSKADSKLAPNFKGYKPPTCNTTYAPNQFFDVVLKHSSRGCVRVVAYLIRKTLGWSDANGNPQNPEATVSFNEFIKEAGVSRGALKEAINEALEKRFIECLRFGKPHAPGESGYSARYRLQWDERDVYITDPDRFEGFYSANGNLTHIPNDFFDVTVKSEPLAVTQVVGAIIRHTIGWQEGRYGFRRQQVSMSFAQLMRRTCIGSSRTVAGAIRAALEGNHIVRLQQGRFDPRAGLESSAAIYGVKWLDQAEALDGSKSKPVTTASFGGANPLSVQKGKRQDGSRRNSDNGSREKAVCVQEGQRRAFKRESAIENNPLNNTLKQQQTAVDALVREGIEHCKASELVHIHGAHRVNRQVALLPKRRIRESRTGLLITAIERDLPPPSTLPAEQNTRPANRALEVTRDEHRDRFYSAYLSHVLSRIDPSSIDQAFEAKTNERLASWRRLSVRCYDETLAKLADPGQRQMMVAEFASEHGKELGLAVPTFWEWDTRHNPDGYRKESIR